MGRTDRVKTIENNPWNNSSGIGNEDSGNSKAVVSVGKEEAEASNEAVSSAQTKDEKRVVGTDASSADKDVLATNFETDDGNLEGKHADKKMD